MLDDSLFDDPTGLANADTGGLLRSAALGGAQVRAATEAAGEAELHELVDTRPRALVLLRRPGVSTATCQLLASLAGPRCPVPVVLAETAPAWVGPLDVVFAHTDDVGDSVLAESVEVAARRGASVVLSAPSEGPVAAAGAGRARLISPKIPIPAALSFPHAFTVGLNMLTTLDLLGTDTDVLADELDREAERAHPNNEPLTNPAKTLALRVADRAPLLWGLDPVSTAVAEHGAFALGYHVGIAGEAASYAHATSRRALYHAVTSTGSEADLFADPDDLVERTSPRVFLVSVRYDTSAETNERTAVEALPTADLVTPGESAREDAAVRAALLAARFDLASVYLGLAEGTVNGAQALLLR